MQGLLTCCHECPNGPHLLMHRQGGGETRSREGKCSTSGERPVLRGNPVLEASFLKLVLLYEEMSIRYQVPVIAQADQI